MEQAANRLANSADVVVVLKGNRTYVTDGSRDYRNETGNPGMATAGSGDVLTGVITSLVGQGVPAYEAACLGVYVHGSAGDFAAEAMGEMSLVATDIIENLSAAFKKHAYGSGATIGFNLDRKL
jgi:NAD(P)H-hydrate epimerase